MDRICVAVWLICLFYVEKSDECNKDDIFAIIGCDVSLHWTLGKTLVEAIHATVYHSSVKIAQILDGDCETMDNLSANCNISKDEDEWILSLTIFNVTEHMRGDYSLRHFGPDKGNKNTSKRLVVIGKPSVMELRKPVLYHALELSCNNSFGLQCFTYRWKVNGSDVSPIRIANAYYVPSLNLTDNFSKVTCQVCLIKTASNVSSEICKNDVCSGDSEPYEIKVIYGPDNISLGVNESNFYIKEYEPFTIECFANCSPKCIFSWKVEDFLEGEKQFMTSEKLIFTSFKSRMAGEYTCYVTNKETNMTAKSNPIRLMLDNEDKVTDAEEEGTMGHVYTAMIGMGLVGFALLLAVIGILLVMQWHRNASNKTDSSLLTQPVANLQIPTNGGLSVGISRIQNRPLPLPNTQETAFITPYRQMDPSNKRKSKSLHNLLDSAQECFYPLRDGVSLQLLQPHSHKKGSSHMNITEDYTLRRNRRFSSYEEKQLGDISELVNGVKLKDLYSKVRKDKKTNKDEQNVGAKTASLCNLRHESFEEGPHEDLYSTIDEASLSVDYYARDNSTNENSNVEQRNAIHRESDYEYTDLPNKQNS